MALFTKAIKSRKAWAKKSKKCLSYNEDFLETYRS